MRESYGSIRSSEGEIARGIELGSVGRNHCSVTSEPPLIHDKRPGVPNLIRTSVSTKGNNGEDVNEELKNLCNANTKDASLLRDRIKDNEDGPTASLCTAKEDEVADREKVFQEALLPALSIEQQRGILSSYACSVFAAYRIFSYAAYSEKTARSVVDVPGQRQIFLLSASTGMSIGELERYGGSLPLPHVLRKHCRYE